MNLPRRIRPHVNPLSQLQEYYFDGFTNNNPLIVDIGSAKGEFVMGLLERYPEYNYIALEVRKPLATYLQQQWSDRDNVVVFDGDANRNLRTLLTPSIDRGVPVLALCINFPDPWLKDRHKKRRVVRQDFLDDTHTWIPEDTVLVLQTDQKPVFDDTIELLTADNRWRIEYFTEPFMNVPTDWEQAKVREGCEIYRVKWWKKPALSDTIES